MGLSNKKMRQPLVAIVVLNWNGLHDTLKCFESLETITYPDYELMLVDNGSTDGSAACLRARYPDIAIIENKENLGFAEGNNVGKHALAKRTHYVLLLNNDTIVAPAFLDALVTLAESDPRHVPLLYRYDMFLI